MYYRDLSDRHHFYLLGQDKPHSISAGIKPLSSAADAKFREMAPNLLPHSKTQLQKVKVQGPGEKFIAQQAIKVSKDIHPIFWRKTLHVPQTGQE